MAMDFERVFGVRKPITHALNGSYPNGAIKARAACGETMLGPVADPAALPFERRAEATCHICRAS